MNNSIAHCACILALAALLTPGSLFAQEQIQLGDKTYRQIDDKWYEVAADTTFEVHPTVVTIKFREGIGVAARDSLYRSQNLREIRANRLGFIDVQIPSGADPIEVVGQLSTVTGIESAEVNTIGVYWPVMTPNDPNFVNQWHLARTNVAPNPAASAWDMTTGSQTLVIGILDSGTDIAHEDLIGNSWVNPGEDLDGDQALDPTQPDHLDNDDENGIDDDGNGLIDDLAGWDFANGNNDVRGPFFHGTHVAGIVGAMTNNGLGVAGVAGGWASTPGVRLMAIGVGDFGPDASILDDAIIYAADNGARIITLSLSVGNTAAIDAALAYAFNTKGVFIDNAAGNSSGAVGYPATNANVVAVSATDQTDALAGFSNRGPEIELAAPGVTIWSTRLSNTYNQGGGTSYASPQVAGVAGLLLSCDPSLTNAQVRTLLEANAVDLGTAGRDNFFGFGRIDALATLNAAGCNEPPGFKRGLSIHAGVAIPSGVLNSTTGPGPTINVDITFPIIPQVAWDARVGYSRFNGTGGAGNVSIWNLSSNIKWIPTLALPWAFVNGGLGGYYIDATSAWEFGYNLGLGIGQPVGSDLTFEVTGNYHSTVTGTPDFRFWKLQIGLIWHF